MFGSNFPVCSLTSDYKTLFEAMRDLVPAPNRQQVFHDTAHAFYFQGPKPACLSHEMHRSRGLKRIGSQSLPTALGDQKPVAG